METLKLEKFQDSKLDNLQIIKGGEADWCFTTLDGVEQGDMITGNTYYVGNGDGTYTPKRKLTAADEGAC